MEDLLKLWEVRLEVLSTNELATILELSQKQTIRKLKKYEKDGWLTYTPGKGRGNKCEIEWHQNVETIFRERLEKPEYFTEILKWIQLDKLPRQFVPLFISAILFSNKPSNASLTIPIYNKNLQLNPHAHIDTESAWIISMILSRLVDEHGVGDVAYHWEERENQFHFFIRPNLYWHNGEMVLIDQIIKSLKKSFQQTKFDYYNSKLKNLVAINNRIIIDYEGPLTELLALFGQIEFSIQYKESGTGAFVISRANQGIYQLSANKNYHLSRPIFSEILLQPIPSQIQRKITLLEEDHLEWKEVWEHAGTFYLYSKLNLDSLNERSILKFFYYFAMKVSQLDETKIGIHKQDNTDLDIIPNCKVGYVVNKNKFVQLLNSIGEGHVQVEHLEIKDLYNLTKIANYDFLIVPMYESDLPYIEDEFDTLFNFKIPLYMSNRKMFYPKNFIRMGRDFYGYPNLRESYLID